METASCTGCDLLPVFRDYVDKGLSYHSVSCNEKVDVLSASLVKEFIVNGADC